MYTGQRKERASEEREEETCITAQRPVTGDWPVELYIGHGHGNGDYRTFNGLMAPFFLSLLL